MATSDHAREPDEGERDVIRRHVDAFASAHPYRDGPDMVASGGKFFRKFGFDPVGEYTREQVERMSEEYEAQAPSVPKGP